MKIESTIKTIVENDDVIYPVLSDLRNLENFKDRIPQDKVREVKLSQDSVSFTVDPVGELTLSIVDREPNKTLKFTAEKSPVDFFLWIQLKQMGEKDTKLKITLKADVNPMLKMMVEKPLSNFVEMLADALTTVQYADVNSQQNLNA